MNSDSSAKSKRVTRSQAKSLTDPIELKSPENAKKSLKEETKAPVKSQRRSLPNPKESKEPEKSSSDIKIDKITPTQTPRKRGRPRKEDSIKAADQKLKLKQQTLSEVVSTARKSRSKDSSLIEPQDIPISDEDDENESSDKDDDFVIDEKDIEDEEEVAETDDGSDFNSDEDEPKGRKRTKTKKKEKPKTPKKDTKQLTTATIEISNEIPQAANLPKIQNWEFILDEETKQFKYPKLPEIAESELKKFLSPKSKPKCEIFACPYCDKVFTYVLCFKTHLFSCVKNTESNYQMLCAYNGCNFSANKKQVVLDHYKLMHLKQTPGKLAKNVQSSYSSINSCQLSNILNYYKHIVDNYETLKPIDEFIEKSCGDKSNYRPKLVNFGADDPRFDLSFDIDNSRIKLRPFEVYKGKDFEVFNLRRQVTALDWCSNHFSVDREQYLAIATLPPNWLVSSEQDFEVKMNQVNEAFECPNLIYIYKHEGNLLNEGRLAKMSRENCFAIYNEKIGNIYTLKWRPDCGLVALKSRKKSLGYLVASGSDGSAYVYFVEDLFKKQESGDIVVFEANFEVVLRVDATLYGQCTCADWSQVDGATRVATGHSNGSIVLFDLSETFSYKANSSELVAMPLQAIRAHVTFVKAIKWHKTNGDILASGSSFNREIKLVFYLLGYLDSL